jgi:hypothetical protein
MLKPWHKEDIWAALRARGWTDPVAVTPTDYAVGQAYAVSRANDHLTLLFVADVGQGYTNDKSLEEVLIAGRTTHSLWLNRRRDAKWRADLHAWADALSSVISRGA